VAAEQYIAGQPEDLHPLLRAVRDLIVDELPEVQESLKWGMLHYRCGDHLAYLEGRGDHVNLGLFHGAELPDPDGLLVGSGDRLRRVTLRALDDLREAPLRALLRAARVREADTR
jgi:hypothetical protein